MGSMVESSKENAQATQAMVGDHKETVQHLGKSTEESIKALRWAQEDQANRMVQLVGDSSRLNRAVIVLLLLGVAALVAIFFAVVNR